MKPIIKLAETDAEREALFRFRYRIYVEEMGREQHYADHARRLIEEPLDHTAANHIALLGDEVVGCIRWNSGRDTSFGPYEDLYAMRCAGRYFPRRCGITTKFMMAPEFRRSLLPVRLGVACFAHARRAGVIADFMDCNPHLEGQFAAYGYRPYRGRVHHPDYGDVLPMLLVTVDLAHLEHTGSPFCRVERENPRDPAAVAFFEENVFHTMQSTQELAA